MRQFKHSIAVVALMLPAAALAEEPEKSWKGDTELGFVVTDGNTETKTVNGKLDLTNEQEKWRHNVHAEALNTSEQETTSAEKYQASWKTDYKFTVADFVFTSLSYEDDRFNASGYDYQATISAGYGRTLIKSDVQLLSLEAGPGYRYSKIKATDGSEEEAILRTAAKYRYKLSKTSEFQQDLNVDVGEEETVTKSVTAVKAQIVGELAMKVSLTVRNTNEALPGKDSTDTETALTLVYSF